MDVSELDYELPAELIAQHPAERRDASRLLVFDRAAGEIRHRRFGDLPQQLPEGALVVVNDTKVFPARLRVRRPSGGQAEILLLERIEATIWEALARPSSGSVMYGGSGVSPSTSPSSRSAEGAGVCGSRGRSRARLRCRRTSRSRSRIRSATRRCTRTSRARLRLRPRGSTSRTTCSQGSTSSR